MESALAQDWRAVVVALCALSAAAATGRQRSGAARYAASTLISYFVSFIPALMLGLILWVAAGR
ncbi:MAG: hypothetical protein Kow0025_11670 [Thermodesulfovibrionales bacterium]